MRTTFLRLLSCLVVLVGVLVTLAACGDDRPSGSSGSTPPPAATPAAKPKKPGDPY